MPADKRQVDGDGRLLFRAAELNKQLLRAGAGYGGCRHVGAAGNSRSDVIRAMAAEAESEGWITRAATAMADYITTHLPRPDGTFIEVRSNHRETRFLTST